LISQLEIDMMKLYGEALPPSLLIGGPRPTLPADIFAVLKESLDYLNHFFLC